MSLCMYTYPLLCVPSLPELKAWTPHSEFALKIAPDCWINGLWPLQPFIFTCAPPVSLSLSVYVCVCVILCDLCLLGCKMCAVVLYSIFGIAICCETTFFLWFTERKFFLSQLFTEMHFSLNYWEEIIFLWIIERNLLKFCFFLVIHSLSKCLVPVHNFLLVI